MEKIFKKIRVLIVLGMIVSLGIEMKYKAVFTVKCIPKCIRFEVRCV